MAFILTQMTCFFFLIIVKDYLHTGWRSRINLFHNAILLWYTTKMASILAKTVAKSHVHI